MPELKIKRPCNDCPFRRNAAPGWLGADTPQNFASNALADYSLFPLPCHQTIDYSDPDWQATQYEESALCAGALIFCKNNYKRPFDPERAAWIDAVEHDANVFRYPWEFIEYHGGELDELQREVKERVVAKSR